MSLKTAFRETYDGFKSLLTGMRITAREAAKPIITVQYPHETLKMPERFRGHVKLVLDPETGKSRCTACNLCVRACPSDCIEVDGLKREGEKKKSVTEYRVDFTTCSLCGSCVEACPQDAIVYSKDYNVVSQHREDFTRMDMMKKLDAEAKVWAQTHPAPATPPATPAPSPAAAPAPAPAAPAATAKAPAPGSAIPATPAAAATPAAPAAAAAAPAAKPAAPAPSPTPTPPPAPISATPSAAPQASDQKTA